MIRIRCPHCKSWPNWFDPAKSYPQPGAAAEGGCPVCQKRIVYPVPQTRTLAEADRLARKGAA